MWSIKKIFHYNELTGNSYLLLSRNVKPSKNKNSDLFRHWVLTNYPDPKDIPASLKDKKLGRYMCWLQGKCESLAFEQEVMKLMEETGIKLNVYKPPKETTILVSGWLPSILPVVTYDLKLKKIKDDKYTKHVMELLGYGDAPIPAYRIVGIEWIAKKPLNGKNLIPFIDWFANPYKKRIEITFTKNNMIKRWSGQYKCHIKKYWREADWNTITRENYKTGSILQLLGNGSHLDIIPSRKQKMIPKFFESYFEYNNCLPIFTLMDYKRLQYKILPAKELPFHLSTKYDKYCEDIISSKQKEIRSRWNRLSANPENLLLQGQDYLYTADINDYKRLCILLNRNVPEKQILDELEDANAFIKLLNNKTCVPVDGKRTTSTKYIHKVGNVWATVYDIDNSRQILNWLKDIPLSINKSIISKDIPLNTEVILKHSDDKIHWWCNYSYSNVKLKRESDKFIIGNAHNFTQEDWVEFIKGPKPLCIVGRTDILTPGRGNIFYDYAMRTQKITCQLNTYPICENIEHMSYAEANLKYWADAQIYVSSKTDKDIYKKFPPATKLKRKWLFNPKRIVTEISSDQGCIWVKESDGTENNSVKNILNHPYSDANIICTWESYQQVNTAVLICTKNTNAIDVYRVKSFAKNKVILVEVEMAPTLQYNIKESASLINIQ